MSSSERRKLFVGIDYGTTFSGIAYALPTLSDGKDIEVVTTWPGKAGTNTNLFEKVPSKISYSDENGGATKAKNTDGTLWGYEVKPSSVNYSWTKLLLEPQTERSDHDDTTNSVSEEREDRGLLRLPNGKTAVDVVADYLRKLYKHCMRTLKKRYAAFLPITPIEFWFTVPAIWSDQAQNATKQAALKAGFGSRSLDTIRMITEPEAGVLAAMKTQVEITREALKPDTGILVCDCGGGTVDLTSYVIDSLEPVLKLRETCAGTGRKCGATLIDQNFHNLMSNRFGTAFTKRPMEKTGPGSKFMEDFQRIKHNFSYANQTTTEPIGLKMPDLDMNRIDASHYDVDEDEILLSWKDLKSCFDPVVNQIITLLSQQVKATGDNGYPKIQTIILLGGFGSSDYLWGTVRHWAQGKDIQTIIPKNPWSAIARGAALRGLEGSKVPVTKCRRHYGYTIDCKFDPALDRDSEDSTFEDEKTGLKMTKHCMEWIFKINDEIIHNTNKPMPFRQRYYPHKRSTTLALNIYSCSLNIAPRKKSSQVNFVGTIQVNVKDVDLSACESHWDKRGNRYYRIAFLANVTLRGDEGVMQVTVMWNGKECGSGKLHFSDEASETLNETVISVS
ncbi:hypothetical protein GJ744_009995 [Endocarpon pusillum]|uniref:Actin-like ATPase domain-containing protein n=1 Tax=Endocarpon pusillum TaxID=364733 RepID=A0A8H7AIU1_9EURO|nr:hypothetical protein GJ744_009995 [Endocarpon pusillum]